jgi:hypothetical protein
LQGLIVWARYAGMLITQRCDSLVRKDYALIQDGLALGTLEYN